ncbi:hypothetical protein [Nocardia sp. NPDC051750]|uniref:hypothetical protein n=1 Tax=Nocardia sp. NPDC051750 TaxID=3364325 RepID=UPI0037A6F846
MTIGRALPVATPAASDAARPALAANSRHRGADYPDTGFPSRLRRLPMVVPAVVPANPVQALIMALSQVMCSLSSGGGCAIIM